MSDNQDLQNDVTARRETMEEADVLLMLKPVEQRRHRTRRTL